MSWRESMEPARMQRVAIVAPRESFRDVLVEIAGRGIAELDVADDPGLGASGRLLQTVPADAGIPAALARNVVDASEIVRAGRIDLLRGEAQLEERDGAAVERRLVRGTVGWMPADEIAPTARAIEPFGGTVVPLPTPRGFDPPTLTHRAGRLNRSFAPLMDTYATVPYADVDPSALAGLAFVVMYGMMFADAGQGTLLILLGILVRMGRPRRLARFRSAWPFMVGAGITAVFFGVLFGEFFGPTGVLPVLWVKPLEEPILLLEVAIGVGATLLAGAYILGTVNRWREGGWRLALVSSSGFAGVAVFLGLGLLALGAYAGSRPLVIAAACVGVGGLALTYVGLLAGSSGGGAGAAEAAVELFDGVIRLGSNIVSFARLAAFGLAHAALGAIVWEGTTGLWAMGGLACIAAVVLFLVGNALTFTLQAVVAGVQALRLEYYELFSRVFVSEGRPFRPWFVPTTRERVP